MEPRSGSAWAFPTWKKWKRKVAGVDASESPEAFAVFAGENVAGLFGTYFALRWKASLCNPAGVLVADDGVPFNSARLAVAMGMQWSELEVVVLRMLKARLLVEVPLAELAMPVKGDAIPQKFDEWWSKYPSARRVNRAMCLRVWRSRSLDAIGDEILAGLEKHLVSEQWWNDGGKYVPLTTTWLSQDRWTQDLKPRGKIVIHSMLDGPRPTSRRDDSDYDPEVIVKVPDEIFK
jgi:hypothetical protein